MASGETVKNETSTDRADVGKAQLLLNLLPRERHLTADDDLPPLAHWVHFPTMSRLKDLGEDGHLAFKKGIIPDTGLPRRMWAGSRVQFLSAAKDGQKLERVTKLAKLERKTGRRGQLAFVTLVHDITADGVPIIHEEQDLVFREGVKGETQPALSKTVPKRETWDAEEDITASSVMLFRYSALTYNSHRIHYDRNYAIGSENYPGLVVHGPLIATLLLDFALRKYEGSKAVSFEFRAVAPLFGDEPFVLQSRRNVDEVIMQASDLHGAIAVTAKAIFV